MPPLNPDLRRPFEKSILDAREAAEAACRAALGALAVQSDKPHPSMTEEERGLRRALRAKERQLGGFEQLVSDCAYEQWHRMLFARFLAETGLLMHPSGVAVSLDDCAELADEEGEPDAWMLAARYAQQMLPGIFRNEDPSHRLRLAPEGRHTLERILAGIPPDIFTADDALGWVYQFWQTKAKQQVNASERKIGGADLAPVTQLFTENYMVRFLLENSLGAWWAARHPQSRLVKEFDYLRFPEDGSPAAGEFEGWPDRAAEVTVMDPCMGSGHFLVVAFEMLRRMRIEEEGLSETEAGDAVLRDNIFGLELDPRCTQLGAFALAFAAWKTGGFRPVPLPNVACSGIGVAGQIEEWRKLAKRDEKLIRTLERLHALFVNAPILGSLLDPRRTVESGDLYSLDYGDVAPILERALEAEASDPAAAVFGGAAVAAARAADFLSRRYSLVATNPPFLGRRHQAVQLIDFADVHMPRARADLAAMMLVRATRLPQHGGGLAVVIPQGMTTLKGFQEFREDLYESLRLRFYSRLGAGAFSEVSGEVVKVALLVASLGDMDEHPQFAAIDCSQAHAANGKAHALISSSLLFIDQEQLKTVPEARLVIESVGDAARLKEYAVVFKGLTTGDDPRFRRRFWEFSDRPSRSEFFQSGSNSHAEVDGCYDLLLIDDLAANPPPGYRAMSAAPLNKRGVAVGHVGSIKAASYTGVRYDQSVAVLIPKKAQDLSAIWCYCRSDDFPSAVRRLDSSIKVTDGTLVDVPFDLERWQKIAKERYPKGLPEPHSGDPTQWIFRGHPKDSDRPLQVAVARLLGCRWPEQPEQDDLESFADPDGIVSLPPVRTEQPAAERLRALLAAAYGEEFTPSLLDRLLQAEGAKKRDLDAWLREEFFAAHCKLFHNRPFIWHIWDGRKDGFSALVNYHRLDRAMLEKLTYTYLGWWITAQKAEVQKGATGAEPRLAAALELQEKLKLIAEGEPPYDVYVRWKPLTEQPIGWEPDLNDGVRLNVRPFVRAGVLRRKFSVNWNKDRGKDPDGSERINDRPYTRAEKMAARESGGG